MSKILIVEDDRNSRVALQKALESLPTEIELAESAEQALEHLSASPFDLVLSDIVMPGMDGIELLENIRSRYPSILVIMMTAFGTVGKAVRAMKEGAYDFIEKPLDLHRVRQTVSDALGDTLSLQRQDQLTQQLSSPQGFHGLIGASSAMRKVYESIIQVANSRATVLIRGESGTGKEGVAQAIHECSPRQNRPFVPVHCASLSESLLESELFGHVQGAFTNAMNDRIGRFESAGNGTLFLDEIGDLPLPMQMKLLRVLQERVFERVGSNKQQPLEARLICATHRNLEDLVQKGAFREDFFYRVSVIEIEIPPLRDRGSSDLRLLIDHFIQKFNSQNERDVRGLDSVAETLLFDYSWPGNVRELQNVIENAVVMSRTDSISEELLPLKIRQDAPESKDVIRVPVGSTLKDIERKMIRQTLQSVDGNKTQAAKILGIGLRTLHRKAQEYEL
ncbi:MAG: sigma-54 dependent transcriptional regulator [Planctomycetota bacterium]|jgi:DNA-binding NtrC family response regulator|nr:sigma-54 dependent transcriptional regulator [Planctomycetota bacterium]